MIFNLLVFENSKGINKSKASDNASLNFAIRNIFFSIWLYCDLHL